ELLGSEVLCNECLHLVIDAAGLVQGLGSNQRRTLRGGVAFSQRQGLHGVAVFDRVDTSNRGPNVAFKLHQVIGLQPSDGLSHRHDGHAKLMGNRRQDKPVAGFIVPGCDALQHMLMSLIGFGKASGLHLLALLRAVSLVLGFPFTRWWEEAINGSTVLDLFVDPLVLLFLFEGLVNNFDEHLRRNDYDSVVITDDDVAGLYGGATASDGAVHFPRDVTTTQHCRVVAVGIDRNVYVQHSSGVTDATVGNDRVRAA